MQSTDILQLFKQQCYSCIAKNSAAINQLIATIDQISLARLKNRNNIPKHLFEELKKGTADVVEAMKDSIMCHDLQDIANQVIAQLKAVEDAKGEFIIEKYWEKKQNFWLQLSESELKLELTTLEAMQSHYESLQVAVENQSAPPQVILTKVPTQLTNRRTVLNPIIFTQ